MPIVDPSKIRPDVNDYLKQFRSKMGNMLKSSLLRRFYLLPKITKILKKINIYHERFMREHITDLKMLGSWLSKDEMLTYIRFYRKLETELNDKVLKLYPLPANVQIEKFSINGIPAVWEIPPGVSSSKVLFFIHGGAWSAGSAYGSRRFHVSITSHVGLKNFSIDYRLAPEYPFPAGLDDCVSSYKWLLANGYKSKDIIVAGESAGGNLALATVLKLKQDGISLPAGVFVLSPATDFTFSDPTFFTNGETDPILGDGGNFWNFATYVGQENPKNPLISPLFGDFRGFPPLLLQVSTTEMLYSDSARLAEKARAAGVFVTLNAWEGMVHVFQYVGSFDPVWKEIPEAFEQMKKFVQRVLP
jgi:acetyl esterase/lipase